MAPLPGPSSILAGAVDAGGSTWASGVPSGSGASMGINSGVPWRRLGVRIAKAIAVPLLGLARWRGIRHNDALAVILWGRPRRC